MTTQHTGNIIRTSFENTLAKVRNVEAVGAIALIGLAPDFETHSSQMAAAGLGLGAAAAVTEFFRRVAINITNSIE